MQETLEIYANHTEEIDTFLIETIHNMGNMQRHAKDNFKKIFKFFPSLELVYVCDVDTYQQTSPNIYKDKTVDTPIGRNRSYLLKKIDLENDDISITKPYVSSATGKSCVTLIKQEDDKIYFFDFKLETLLQRLGIIERDEIFSTLTKSFYLIASLSMVILALFTIGYALYSFGHSIFVENEISIHAIFKPVISLTLGLAIFDLAKTILEQEVLFKSYSKNSSNEYKVLTKFMITIIIALLIESLMVVFKIAIDDYSKMINATYLIGGIGILIISLATFIYLSSKKN